MAKKLYRSRTDSILAGVCGGLAEYFDIDPSLVRVGAVLLTLAWGAGLLAYLVLWLIVPQKPLESSLGEEERAETGVHGAAFEKSERDRGVFFVGMILTIIGVLLLMNNYVSFAWLSLHKLWPLLIIVVGIIIIARGSSRKENED
jgi:phage shock protein C